MDRDSSSSRGGPGLFARFARTTAGQAGRPWAFIAAALVVLAWAVSGPLFQFSSTWQLVINTGTTIVTFLMVFLIQNTQNRDSQAIHLKLDALIDAFEDVREDMIDIEDASEDEIREALEEFRQRREMASKVAENGDSRLVTPKLAGGR